MNNLEHYFTGDSSWKAFSDLYKNSSDPSIVRALKNIFPDESLAYAIAGIIGETSLQWIKRKMPALDNLCPIDCTENEVLAKRLKTMLMRMDL